MVVAYLFLVLSGEVDSPRYDCMRHQINYFKLEMPVSNIINKYPYNTLPPAQTRPRTPFFTGPAASPAGQKCGASLWFDYQWMDFEKVFFEMFVNSTGSCPLSTVTINVHQGNGVTRKVVINQLDGSLTGTTFAEQHVFVVAPNWYNNAYHWFIQDAKPTYTFSFGGVTCDASCSSTSVTVATTATTATTTSSSVAAVSSSAAAATATNSATTSSLRKKQQLLPPPSGSI
eukprot:TRINITY_DN12492_c0_g1_i1.p1 TRINITY_DN12492_c0_g1~~TRINITY_DN12492_c0_g1_i1.p1  ORF type:complete len:230 (-),score=66.52 TRINITY_DN12492_c0_g1_i1:100-789(-)